MIIEKNDCSLIH